MATPSPGRSAVTQTSPDRRRSLRLDVLDRLDGQVVMFNIPVELQDISAGGLAANSLVPFPVGSRHLLRLTTRTGREVVIASTVVHVRPSESPNGLQCFAIGFAFIEDHSNKSEGDIQTLIEAVQADAAE